MFKLDDILHEFHKAHQQSKNLMAHRIGLPAVLMGLLILLNWISISLGGALHITFSWLLIAGLLAIYYPMNIKLGAAMTVLLGIMNLIALWIGYPRPSAFGFLVFLILMGGGLAAMWFGHGFEKGKKITVNIRQLIAAPVFLLLELSHVLKIEQYLDLPKKQSTHK
jgi:uncharacterized membrane protein YGL010W